ACRVAKTALHLVSQRDCRDEFLTSRANAFRSRKCRRNIITRMRRFFRQISVIEIEVTNATARRERSPVRRSLMRRSDNCRSILRRKFRRDFSRDRARLFIPRSQRATKRIGYAAPHFVHHFRSEERRVGKERRTRW